MSPEDACHKLVQLYHLRTWHRAQVSKLLQDTVLPDELHMRRQRNDTGPMVGDVVVWQDNADAFEDVQAAVVTCVKERNIVESIKVAGTSIGSVAGRCGQVAFMPGTPQTELHLRRLAWTARQALNSCARYKNMFIHDLQRSHVVRLFIHRFQRSSQGPYYVIATS